jgi:hypothetical protein
MEEIGFQFRVLYRDNDLVKVRASAWNGVFGGAADVYLGSGRLGEIASQLRGFPEGSSDSREITLGTIGSESAGGGMSMHFYCIGQSSHAFVETNIESDCDSKGKVQSARLLLPIEANAIDLFVAELRRLDIGTAATACLRANISSSD